MGTIIIILVIIGIVSIARRQSQNQYAGDRRLKVDYSFGLSKLQIIKKAIENIKYEEAESLIMQLDADELTQAIDHICLNGTEQFLLDWNKDSSSEISLLFLGVYYAHTAWIKRSQQQTKGLEGYQILGFIEWQQKASDLLVKVQQDELLKTEACSRLIRLSMGLNNLDAAIDYFRECSDSNPNHIWAHIHIAEAIQPKWGGSTELIIDFVDSLVEDPLIQQIVKLKLHWDSFLAGTDLYGGEMSEWPEKAKNLLVSVHTELEENRQESIHRYVVYNYLSVMATEIGEEELQKIYTEKIEGYYTLYPAGILN